MVVLNSQWSYIVCIFRQQACGNEWTGWVHITAIAGSVTGTISQSLVYDIRPIRHVNICRPLFGPTCRKRQSADDKKKGEEGCHTRKPVIIYWIFRSQKLLFVHVKQGNRRAFTPALEFFVCAEPQLFHPLYSEEGNRITTYMAINIQPATNILIYGHRQKKNPLLKIDPSIRCVFSPFSFLFSFLHFRFNVSVLFCVYFFCRKSSPHTNLKIKLIISHWECLSFSRAIRTAPQRDSSPLRSLIGNGAPIRATNDTNETIVREKNGTEIK